MPPTAEDAVSEGSIYRLVREKLRYKRELGTASRSYIEQQNTFRTAWVHLHRPSTKYLPGAVSLPADHTVLLTVNSRIEAA